MNIVILLVILLILVIVHEFGHFFSAKKFGIRVDEFGFGFPPKIFGKKFGETEYSFNLLPIGGFVKIFGENPNDENIKGKDAPRSFTNKPKWQQAIVLFAGVFANFLLAWLLFSIGFMSGLPTSVGSEPKGYDVIDPHLVLVSVLPDSPAEKGGLMPGDKIISVSDGKDILGNINPENLKSFIASHGDREINFSYIRGKDREAGKTKIIPDKSNGGAPVIGISMDQIGIVKLPFFRSLWEGLKLDIEAIKMTTIGIFTLIKDGITGNGGNIMSQVTGPVGLAGVVGNAYDFGLIYLLSLAAVISVNLAVINLVPFPALDGGRLLFLLVEKIKGSPLSPKFANSANMVGFFILIALMVFVTYNDVLRLY